ncbi:hypothetical protein GCM10010415_64010 [Streptomyces atrovirens]
MSTGQDGAHAIRSPARPAGRIREVRESREPGREEPGGTTGRGARRIGQIERGAPDARFHGLLIAQAFDVPPADPAVDRAAVRPPAVHGTSAAPPGRGEGPAGESGRSLRAEGHMTDPPGRGPDRARDPTQWGP